MKRELLPLILGFALACSTSTTGPADLTTEETVGGHDATQTTLSIETPVDGEWRNQSPVLVTGRVHGTTLGEVEVNGTLVAFSEGRYSFWLPVEEGDTLISVVHPASNANAAVTIHVDRLPPVLTTTSPARGSVITTAAAGINMQFTATDEYGLSALSAGGVAVLPDGTSPQAVDQVAPAKPGLNLVAAEVTDPHGNLAREHRAVMAGPFVPCDQLATSPTALMVLGSQALEVLGTATSDILAGFDFGSYLGDHNPLYTSDSFTVTVDSLTLTNPKVVLATDQTESGLLAISFQAEEVLASGTILLVGSGTLLTFEVEVWELALSAKASVGLSDSVPKTIRVEPKEIITEAYSIKLHAKDQQNNEVVPPTEVSGNFLEALGKMAAGFAGDALSSVLTGALPLAGGTQAMELMGLPITFAYSILDLAVTPKGLSVTLAALGEITTQPVHAWPHGCLGPLPQLPEVADYAGIQIWLSYPFLNSVLLSAWQQGMTDFVIDQTKMDAWKSQITLVCGMLGSLVDAASPQKAEAPLVVDVVPSLPPVVSTSATLPGGLEMSLGDLQLAFRCGSESNPVASAYLSLELGTALTVTGGKIQVGLAIDRFLVDMEGLTPQSKRRAERELEVFFEQTINQIAGALAGSLVSFDSPGAYGLIPVAGTVGAGASPGWLAVHAMVGMEVAE